MLFRFKHLPSDFLVDELLGDMQRHPDGKIWFIKFEKRNENTMDVIASLCKQTGLTRSQIGIAWLKDKKAHTTQWVSIALDDVTALSRHWDWDLSGQDLVRKSLCFRDTVRICEENYSDRMLGIGRNMWNHFTIRLRKRKALSTKTKERIQDRVSHIQQYGFPNCFGQQRFGKNNFKKAMKFFAQTSIADEKYQLKFTLQAYPSMYFNMQALERYENNAHLVDGDICTRRRDIRTRETGVYRHKGHCVELFDFAKIREHTMDEDICTPTYMTWETVPYTSSWSPTGLMIWAHMLTCPPETQAYQYDKNIIEASGIESHIDLARAYHLYGIRREHIVIPQDLTTSRESGDFVLSFSLPTWSYATVLLWRIFREIDADTCLKNRWLVPVLGE